MEVEKVNNVKINWFDPPKDMDIKPPSGEKLNNTDHRKEITECMKALFTGSQPDGWQPVGKHIETVSSTILDLFKTEVNEKNIIRESHSSGASNRPSDLYVMQDNGSTSVVSDPVFIITPGSILDPAGKTKTGAVYILSGDATNLSKDNTTRIGFEKCIVGDIEFSKGSGIFTVTIPTSLTSINGGKIRGVFDSITFKPIISADNESRFFQGNPIKNGLIRDAISEIKSSRNVELNKHEIMAHILMKELGDTLQVEWLRRLYTLSAAQMVTASEQKIQSQITADNSVIITSDSVVRLRAVVNRIPVIFSDMKGKSTYICPTSGADVAVMNKKFITTMLKDLNTQNKKIVDLFDSVIAVGNSLRQPDGFLWFGSDWRKSTEVAKGVNVLTQVRDVILLFIKDINTRIGLLNDIEQAKKLVEYNTLISPFVKTKGGDYKIIKTVTYLLPGNRLKFIANAFVPSKINNVNSIIDLPSGQAGGAQEGGAFLRLEFLGLELVTAVYAASLAIGGGSSHQQDEMGYQPVNHHRYASAEQALIDSELAKTIKGVYRKTLPNLEGLIQAARDNLPTILVNRDVVVSFDGNKFLDDIERVHIGAGSENVFSAIDYAMFYCLVKDYHPEIFTYARFMALFIDTTDPLCKEEFGKKHYTTEDSYTWRESDNRFHRNTDYHGEDSVYTTLNSDTLRALVYTRVFLDLFPNFNTSSLHTFIETAYTHFRVETLDIGIKALERVAKIPEAIFSIEKVGGGKGELEYAANQAVELYEFYYSLLLQKNYTPELELRDMIKERLEFIIPFDFSVPDEYKANKSYVESRRSILKLMIGELASLPKVLEYISRARNHVEGFYRYHKNQLASRTIGDLLMALSAHDTSKAYHKPSYKRERPANLANEVRGGRFSKLRITRKTRRIKQRNRSTRIKRSKSKKQN